MRSPLSLVSQVFIINPLFRWRLAISIYTCIFCRAAPNDERQLAGSKASENGVWGQVESEHG